MESSTSSRIGMIVLWLLLFYVIFVLLHRLVLSPLANIPGPKLAAVTGFYEMYYDLVQKARFPWKIVELHRKYGRSLKRLPILLSAELLKVKMINLFSRSYYTNISYRGPYQ